MLDRYVRPLIDPPLNHAATWLAPRLTADAVSWLGFAATLTAGGLIAFRLYLAGLALLLLGRLLDGLDGAVARQTAPTDQGGFLDITLDFIAYSGLVFAFALADPARNALASAYLTFAFVGTGSSFLAFAIMAAKRGIETEDQGKKSLYYLSGLTEGSETILFFVLACLLPGAFPALAYGFGALCWLTTIGRISSSLKVLR